MRHTDDTPSDFDNLDIHPDGDEPRPGPFDDPTYGAKTFAFFVTAGILGSLAILILAIIWWVIAKVIGSI